MFLGLIWHEGVVFLAFPKWGSWRLWSGFSRELHELFWFYQFLGEQRMKHYVHSKQNIFNNNTEYTKEAPKKQIDTDESFTKNNTQPSCDTSIKLDCVTGGATISVPAPAA